MKIDCISNTHGKHNEITHLLTGGDVLIHAGDCTNIGKPKELENFIAWYSDLPYTHKLLVPGNHDFDIENHPDFYRTRMKGFGIDLLIDREIIIDDVVFYGMPWTPIFMNWMNWAFMRTEEQIAESLIFEMPTDVDVLITHGPPRGSLDVVQQFGGIGSVSLDIMCTAYPPLYHIFGQAHYQHGIRHCENTTQVNAAICDEAYEVTRAPITIWY